MARPPKIPSYLICCADQLDWVTKERKYVPDSEHEESLMDELEWYPADGVLVALRRCFSMTFSDEYSLKGMRKTVAHIRRSGVEALQAIPKVIDDLRLKPVPVSKEESDPHKAQLFKFTLVRESLLPTKVSYEGKKRRYLDILGYEIANPLIVTLRTIVGETFVEAFNEDQHDVVIEGIRRKIWQVLPAYNTCLDSIGLEPIAEYRHDEKKPAEKTSS